MVSGESGGFLGGFAAGDECLDLGSVGGVDNESGQLALETLLRKLHDHVELVPELLLIGLSALAVDLDAGEAEGLHHAGSGLEALVGGELAEGGEQVPGEALRAGKVNVIAEGSGVTLGDLALLNKIGEAELEEVSAVVLPDAAEMGLL